MIWNWWRESFQYVSLYHLQEPVVYVWPIRRYRTIAWQFLAYEYIDMLYSKRVFILLSRNHKAVHTKTNARKHTQAHTIAHARVSSHGHLLKHTHEPSRPFSRWSNRTRVMSTMIMLKRSLKEWGYTHTYARALPSIRSPPAQIIRAEMATWHDEKVRTTYNQLIWSNLLRGLWTSFPCTSVKEQILKTWGEGGRRGGRGRLGEGQGEKENLGGGKSERE